MRRSIFLVGILSAALSASCTSVRIPAPASTPPIMDQIDLSGEWEFQDEGTAQRIALDEKGNGSYRWQNGHIVTTSVSSGRWEGNWYQEGNDREGGFEVLLSGDGGEANGTWWYTRIGTRNIPPREQGGSFRLKRLAPAALRPGS